MFWSGNYSAVRELNSLLKEENVTLSQVLEADDILQECKADNKALMLFLTRPDILNELITLITEEPPKNVELSQQYRHANIACEVLTSHLSMLSDRLSSDTVQMNRLCDFVNREPPLNPLLASYFSKTVEMLLEKSPKQDCYLYHIVCLRVLDFFKSRRDFLPNLLRHISTSAIADVFKYFIRLDDLFNKIVMEWFDEHQVLECLIQIMCGSYSTAEYPDTAPQPEKGSGEAAEKEDLNHNQGEHASDDGRRARQAAARRARVAADNACALLGAVVGGGCVGDGSAAPRTAAALGARLGSARGVARLLSAAFTAEGAARARAAAHAAALLLQLAQAAPPAERPALELAVAPHIPLLHHALIHPPPQESGPAPRVGSARLQIAALVAELALSEVHEVCTTLLALGTPGVLLDLLVQFPDNNFLHSAVVSLVRNALCCNSVYSAQYAEHLFGECDMLNRFMDLYEENENKERGPRRGHAGHVALALLAAAGAPARPAGAPAGPGARWAAFMEATLRPLQHALDTPLGGSHPAESIYEVDCIMDTLAANFDFSDMAATANMDDGGDDLTNENEGAARGPPGPAGGPARGPRDDDDDEEEMIKARSNFLELANQRFGDDMWDDAPEPEAEPEAEPGAEPGAEACARDVLRDFTPWARAPSPGGAEGAGGGEGWAQFDAAPAPAPAPSPTAPPAPGAAGADAFTAFWPYPAVDTQDDISSQLSALALSAQTSLASNLLTAMSGMSPAALARLVHIHDADVTSHVPGFTDLPDISTAVVNDISPVADEGTSNIEPVVDKTAEVDKSAAVDDDSLRVDKIVAVDNTRPVDKTDAGDNSPKVDKHYSIVSVGKTVGEDKTSDIAAFSSSPDNKKSSDPWQAVSDKAKPGLSPSEVRQSFDNDDDKKSDTDVRQPDDNDDKDKKEFPQVTDSFKSSDDSDIKSDTDNKAGGSPSIDDKGKSDIEPLEEENKCDNLAESER